MDVSIVHQIRANPQFTELEQRRNIFSWMLTAIMMAIYGGYIYLVAFMPQVMAIRIGDGVMTLGFPIGLGVILSAIVLTGIYILRANSEFDRLTRAVREGSQ